jgi:hypothetical protein
LPDKRRFSDEGWNDSYAAQQRFNFSAHRFSATERYESVGMGVFDTPGRQPSHYGTPTEGIRFGASSGTIDSGREQGHGTVWIEARASNKKINMRTNGAMDRVLWEKVIGDGTDFLFY